MNLPIADDDGDDPDLIQNRVAPPIEPPPDEIARRIQETRELADVDRETGHLTQFWFERVRALCRMLEFTRGSFLPPDHREKYKRALDKLLYLHGEWAQCSPTGDQSRREKLADEAVAAEVAVIALYDFASLGI